MASFHYNIGDTISHKQQQIIQLRINSWRFVRGEGIMSRVEPLAVVGTCESSLMLSQQRVTQRLVPLSSYQLLDVDGWPYYIGQ